MILGYAQKRFVGNALETFNQIKLEGVKIQPTIFSSILPAYDKMGALEQGIDIYQSIMKVDSLSNIM